MYRLIPAFLLLTALGVAAKKPVTLDAVASRPAPGDSGYPVTWAPDGKSFLYRQGQALWRYDIALHSAKEFALLAPIEAMAVKVPEAEVFSWENRRSHEAALEYTPSGNDLLLSANGDLFLWHIATGKAEQLTATPIPEHDPKLSPDGTHVAFRRDHDLYSLDLTTHKETRLTSDGSDTLKNGELDWVYPEELDLETAYWWSPDSRSIAFLQFDVAREPLYPQVDLHGLKANYEPERYPQAGDPNPEVRLGIVTAAGSPVRWIDFGETRQTFLLARVQWMPDSKHVTVQRLTRVQNRLDLLSGDISTGLVQTILTESDPYWINIKDDVRFLKDGRHFLWSSEKSGFRHLYLISSDGKDRQPVTSGEWEVSDVVGVDEKAGEVFYISSEVSPLERHLYSIKMNGEGKRRLTQIAGVHSISMSPDCTQYIDSYSNSESPTRRVLHRRDGSEAAVYREANRKVIDEYEILPTEIVKVKAADGTLLYGRLLKPANFDAKKKYPAIVMVYGGPGVQTIFNTWQGLSWNQALAHRGFVVWQLDNRGSNGRGHAFESAIYHDLGATELTGQKEGIKHLLSLGFVDEARIGISGWSYGGFMTLYSLLHAPDLFRAGIAGAPVTSYRNYDTIYTERYMGLPAENAEGYDRSALPKSAANLKAKLMIVHNIEDDNVLFQNTLQMIDALELAGKDFDLRIYPQKSHGVGGPASKDLLRTTTDFFEKNLKN